MRIHFVNSTTNSEVLFDDFELVEVSDEYTVVSTSDYYPFGMEIEGRSSTVGGADKFRFQGKERDGETGYDYFEARLYDSSIGRFMQVDPMAEKFTSWNPYLAMGNNPMRLVDLDGMAPTDPIKSAKKVLASASEFAKTIYEKTTIRVKAAFSITFGNEAANTKLSVDNTTTAGTNTELTNETNASSSNSVFGQSDKGDSEISLPGGSVTKKSNGDVSVNVGVISVSQESGNLAVDFGIDQSQEVVNVVKATTQLSIGVSVPINAAVQNANTRMANDIQRETQEEIENEQR